MQNQPSVNQPIVLYSDSTYFSGAEKSLALLAEELHRQGKEIIFFCTPETAPRFKPYLSSEITDSRATQLKFSLIWLITLIKKFRQERPMLVVVNMWSPYANTLALVAARLCSIPTIGIYHYYEERTSITGLLTPVKLLAYRLGASLCSRVLTVSQAHLDVLVTQFGFPPTKIGILYNGISKTGTSRPNADHIPRRLLAVGSLEPAKGYDFLIGVVNESATPFELTIAGTGPERTRLEALAKDSPHTIRFLGSVTEMESLYQQSDVLVHPSRFENLSMAILEAMSYGLMILANNVGGNSELVTNNKEGRLLPLDDKEAWSQAIGDVCSLTLSTYRENALERSRKFSTSTQCERFLQEVDKVYLGK